MTSGLNLKGCCKKHTPMKAKKPNQAPLMTKAEFDQIMLANQETLKRDPFGTESGRKEAEALRKGYEDLKAQADAAKKKGRE